MADKKNEEKKLVWKAMQGSIRLGFANRYAEYNGLHLSLSIDYFAYDHVERKDLIELKWSVGEGCGELNANGRKIFPIDVEDPVLGTAYDLFRRRAEAVVKGWVEK